MLVAFASTVGFGAEQAVRADNGAEMVLVPAGEFWMGSDDGNDDEKPRHRVDLDAYYIDRYEITNGLYQRFMEATNRPGPRYWSDSHLNGASQPVVGVNWYDAEAYCRWVGKRLPTEAEWEKAARGDDGRTYPWGEQWDSSRANSKESQRNKAAPVGSYPSGVSPYGAYDMAGNVWEWVADWYAKDYYERSPPAEPAGPGDRTVEGPPWRVLGLPAVSPANDEPPQYYAGPPEHRDRVPLCERTIVAERSERIRMARSTRCTEWPVSRRCSPWPGMVAPSRSLSALASGTFSQASSRRLAAAPLQRRAMFRRSRNHRMDVARAVSARKGTVSLVSIAQPPLPVTTTPDVSEELTMTAKTRESLTP
jgi:hypothetical protein